MRAGSERARVAAEALVEEPLQVRGAGRRPRAGVRHDAEGLGEVELALAERAPEQAGVAAAAGRSARVDRAERALERRAGLGEPGAARRARGVEAARVRAAWVGAEGSQGLDLAWRERGPAVEGPVATQAAAFAQALDVGHAPGEHARAAPPRLDLGRPGGATRG